MEHVHMEGSLQEGVMCGRQREHHALLPLARILLAFVVFLITMRGKLTN